MEGKIGIGTACRLFKAVLQAFKRAFSGSLAGVVNKCCHSAAGGGGGTGGEIIRGIASGAQAQAEVGVRVYNAGQYKQAARVNYPAGRSHCLRGLFYQGYFSVFNENIAKPRAVLENRFAAFYYEVKTHWRKNLRTKIVIL